LPLPVPGKPTAGLQTKTVVVSCQFTGKTQPGVVLNGYSVNPPTILLRGTAETLAEVGNVSIDIRLDDINKSTTLRKQVRLPNGVTGATDAVPVVDVSIDIRER
jgi:YbbR domain-containing protein